MYENIERYVLDMVKQSSPEQTVWNQERLREGKGANWNYIEGCMLTALLSMAEITKNAVYSGFVESLLDFFVR